MTHFFTRLWTEKKLSNWERGSRLEKSCWLAAPLPGLLGLLKRRHGKFADAASETDAKNCCCCRVPFSSPPLFPPLLSRRRELHPLRSKKNHGEKAQKKKKASCHRTQGGDSGPFGVKEHHLVYESAGRSLSATLARAVRCRNRPRSIQRSHMPRAHSISHAHCRWVQLGL